MIQVLNFIDDLKEIRESMPYSDITSELVDGKIKKYENMVEQFENEHEPNQPMLVTGMENY